jgi:hypothetical protein
LFTADLQSADGWSAVKTAVRAAAIVPRNERGQRRRTPSIPGTMAPMSKHPAILKSPASQATYAKVLAAISKLGPFDVEEKKTSLHLTNGRAFAGVHPRATGIILNLVFDAPLKNARVLKSEQVSANRHHVEFKLEDPAEVDTQLVTWIKRAYSLTT